MHQLPKDYLEYIKKTFQWEPVYSTNCNKLNQIKSKDVYRLHCSYYNDTEQCVRTYFKEDERRTELSSISPKAEHELDAGHKILSVNTMVLYMPSYYYNSIIGDSSNNPTILTESSSPT